ncbi:uncharacterized protein [Venturia canescens]|uniref:uncharacterized protein n=1 Tax=Venturia canescens TaxID=32260 RepID=UPI001C9C9FA8|nr:uncharacterized protein LOC122418040 [Venturia canescens]
MSTSSATLVRSCASTTCIQTHQTGFWVGKSRALDGRVLENWRVEETRNCDDSRSASLGGSKMTRYWRDSNARSQWNRRGMGAWNMVRDAVGNGRRFDIAFPTGST